MIKTPQLLLLNGDGWAHIREDIPNHIGSKTWCFGGIDLIDLRSGTWWKIWW